MTTSTTDADFLTKPGKPTKPAAETNVGSGKLTLTASVTGAGTLTKWQYKQKEGTNEYDADWTDISSTSTSLSHTFSGLTNGTDYQYKVRAVNSGGDGAESDASDAAQPKAPTKPAKPANVTATALNRKAAFEWDDPSDSSITRYEYNVNHNATGTGNFTGWSGWTTISGSDETTTSHTFTGLTNGKEYRYQLRAVNAHGDGAVAPGVAPWFYSLTPNQTLTASSITHNSATLTLSDASAAWWYKGSQTNAACVAVAADTATASLTNLASNTSFTYKAYSDSTCSTETTTSATDADFLTAPGKPTKPTAVAGAGHGKLTISSSVTGSGTLTRWEYKQKEGTGGFDDDWTTISSTSTSLSHTVAGLTDGTDYQFKLRAVNSGGNGAESDASDAAKPVDDRGITLWRLPRRWRRAPPRTTASSSRPSPPRA